MTIFAGSAGAEIRGIYDPSKKTYFCRYCRWYVNDMKGSGGMRACPTPRCKNPMGFGIYWKTPRPKLPFDGGGRAAFAR